YSPYPALPSFPTRRSSDLHLACMVINYIAIDQSGKPIGEPQFYGASGFVIEFRDEWFYVTAGHVFQDDFEPNLKAKKIEIISSKIGRAHVGTPVTVKSRMP